MLHGSRLSASSLLGFSLVCFPLAWSAAAEPDVDPKAKGTSSAVEKLVGGTVAGADGVRTPVEPHLTGDQAERADAVHDSLQRLANEVRIGKCKIDFVYQETHESERIPVRELLIVTEIQTAFDKNERRFAFDAKDTLVQQKMANHKEPKFQDGDHFGYVEAGPLKLHWKEPSASIYRYWPESTIPSARDGLWHFDVLATPMHNGMLFRRVNASFDEIATACWGRESGGPAALTEDDETIQLTWKTPDHRESVMTIDKARGGTIRSVQTIVDVPEEFGGRYVSDENSFEWQEINGAWVPVTATYTSHHGIPGQWADYKVRLTIHWESVNQEILEEEFTQDRWKLAPRTRTYDASISRYTHVEETPAPDEIVSREELKKSLFDGTL